MIELRGLTKRYGDARAVDDLSFDVEPGKVTGFLGPNDAGSRRPCGWWSASTGRHLEPPW